VGHGPEAAREGILGSLTFYLVRHAQADWTPDEDRPLSTRGYNDAEKVCHALNAFPISAIYSSPYRRARDTIRPLAVQLNLPLRLAPELRERRLGAFEGPDFFHAVEPTWQQPAFAHPGGESNAAAQARGVSFLEGLRREDLPGTVVLSTHGNLLSLILQAYDPSIGFAFWTSLTMPDVYALSVGPKGVAAISRVWSEDSEA
jgi:2,3-bisphosphoglycerate-dependent phosphoglycerate mutase